MVVISGWANNGIYVFRTQIPVSLPGVTAATPQAHPEIRFLPVLTSFPFSGHPSLQALKPGKRVLEIPVGGKGSSIGGNHKGF
jgi:hypothetical protein